MHNLDSHFEIQTFEVNDDDVTHGIQEHFDPPQQTPIFSHGNEEEVHVPSIGLDILKIKACKVFGVQGKVNKIMENKRRKLDASSFAIVDVIKEFSKGVKEIEKMNMEMIERTTT